MQNHKTAANEYQRNDQAGMAQLDKNANYERAGTAGRFLINKY
jgi:hypothetical protein